MAEHSIPYVIEINFAIKKFIELSREKQLAVYEALQADVHDEIYVKAAIVLLKLVTSVENSHQLTEYANECFGVRLDGYIVWTNLPERAFAFAAYFKKHLKPAGDILTIELLEVPSFEALV